MPTKQFTRRGLRSACAAGLTTIILTASSAGVWTLLDYSQSHALAAAEASQVSDDVQSLVAISFRAVQPAADLTGLRDEARAAALRLEAHLQQLEARHVETARVTPLAGLVERFFAQLNQEDAALRSGDPARAQVIATQAADTTQGQLGLLRDKLVRDLDAAATQAHSATRTALVGLVGLVMAMMAGLLFWLGQQRRRGQAQQADYEARARFEAMASYASDLIVVMEPPGIITYVSPSVRAVLGYEPETWIGRNRLGVVHPDRLAESGAAYAMVLAGYGPVIVDLPVLHADGAWRTVEVNFAPLGDTGASRSVLMTCRDVTERRELERQLTRHAFEDTLTGLPNRALLQDRLAQAVARRERGGRGVAVLLLDLDGFKDINDGFGHSVGDEVLVELARRLTLAVRAGDTTARFGGDEFVVVIEDEAPEQAAQEVAARLQVLLEPPIRVGPNEHRVQVSTGIALDSGTSTEELIRNADLAMYAAKAMGRGHTVTFEPGMHDDARTRVELAMELDGAVERGELVVYFQPTFDLQTRVLVGAEALVRWQHPTRGLLVPGAFIPIAERSGYIAAIGRWVMAEACRQTAAWNWSFDGPRPKSISVNVSGHQLMDPGFVDEVRGVLAETGMPADALVLEITETVLMEHRGLVLTQLQRLKRLGVRIALDDYGTGYSTMARLLKFPVDVLKIDRSFVVASAQGDAGARALVKSIMTLCDDLRMTAIAEGIESAAEAADMQACGCRFGQGYFMGRPMAAEQLEEEMRTSR